MHRLAGAAAAPSVRGSSDGDEGKAVTLLIVVLAAVVLLQRLAIPLGDGQVPLVLPVVLAAIAWGVHARILRADALRVQLYLIAITACTLASLINLWRGISWSLLSLIFLAVTYAPFVLGLQRPTRRTFDRCASFYLRLMVVAAIAGLAQIGTQLAGLPYVDPFEALPSSLVLADYVTTYPVVYESEILKANGFVFLEASFFSQFLALALILHLYLGRRGLAPLLYLGALIASVSGTGIILAAIGTLLLALGRARRRLVPGLLLASAAAVVIVGFSPVASVFQSRLADDATVSQRFVEPYAQVPSSVDADNVSFLVGRGPGTDSAVVEAYAEVNGSDALLAVFPVIPKLALDYGALAGVALLCFILVATLSPGVSYPLAGTLLVMYFTLSGSLLQPSTVYALLVFTTLFTGAAGIRKAEATRALVSRYA